MQTQTPLAKRQDKRRFIITLNVGESGRFQIRSCEIAGGQFRNRISFAEGATLEDVFRPDLAAELRTSFQKLRNMTEVLSLPTFLFEIPGLTLSGMDIMAAKLKKAGTNIIVRFKTFLGGINLALNRNIGFDEPVRDPTADLAANVICDLALPLLDICSSADSGAIEPTDKFGELGQKVHNRSHEIRFQVELLKRYIANQARMDVAPDFAQHRRHLQTVYQAAQKREVSCLY